MGKTARARVLKDNEAKAISRMLRVSPQKLGLVAGLIRGKKVATALADLRFSKKRIALDVDDLVVAEAHVGKAFVIKRWTPRGRGRSGRIFRTFSNLTVIVREQEGKA